MTGSVSPDIHARNVLAWTIGALVLPPVIWLLASWYFEVTTLEQTVSLALSPLLLVYVVSYIGAVILLVGRHLKAIKAGRADPSPENILQAQRSLALMPTLFLVAVTIYCAVGPNTALYGKPFLDGTKYAIDAILGIPVMLTCAVPFFLFMVANLERMAVGIPNSDRYKSPSLSTKMLLIFSFTTFGTGLTLALASISIVYAGASHGDVFAVLTTKLIVAGALTAVVATVNLLLLVGHALKPLRSISDTTLKLARDEEVAEIDTLGRRDELGDIADALKTFTRLIAERRQLAALEDEEKRRTEEDRKAALRQMANALESEVGALIEALNNSANSLQSSAGQMATTAATTSEQATSVARAAEQASVNVQTVAAATVELSHSIKEIAAQADRSQNAALRANDEVHRTSDQIRKLEENVTSIGQILVLINNVAAQTNLLALNATIEAARAGDAGKGFAVVAGEVKALATQTAKATGEIDAKIKAVQLVTADAVAATASLTSVVREMNDISTSVAAAVEEQTAAAVEIDRNVNQAAAGTEKVSQFIGVVEHSSKETGLAAQRIDESSADLSHRADLLKREVSRFLGQVRSDNKTMQTI